MCRHSFTAQYCRFCLTKRLQATVATLRSRDGKPLSLAEQAAWVARKLRGVLF